MSENPVAWRVWWQDFNGHQFGTPKPDKEYRDFATKGEAEDFLASVKCGDCIANMQSKYLKQAKPKAIFDDDRLPEMWKRLTA